MKPTESPETAVQKSKNVIGTIVSLGKNKEASVKVSFTRIHPVYKKALRRTRKFLCHNALPDLVVGDAVEIRQIRPMSKTKYFSIVKKM